MTSKDYILQGIEHADKGRLEKAEKYFRRALEANPGDMAAINNLALMLAKMGDYREAEKILKKAIKRCEHDEGFYQSLKKNLDEIRKMEDRKRKIKKTG